MVSTCPNCTCTRSSMAPGMADIVRLEATLKTLKAEVVNLKESLNEARKGGARAREKLKQDLKESLEEARKEGARAREKLQQEIESLSTKLRAQEGHTGEQRIRSAQENEQHVGTHVHQRPNQREGAEQGAQQHKLEQPVEQSRRTVRVHIAGHTLYACLHAHNTQIRCVLKEGSQSSILHPGHC